MDKLIIESTKKTPDVDFNPNGILKLSGRSIPENSIEFYEPIMEWLEGYEGGEFELSVTLDYFNTSSSKCLFELFKVVSLKEGSLIKWYYEEDDEDMLEAGEDYNDVLDVEFEMISFEDD